MKQKTKFETFIGWVFMVLMLTAFALGGVYVCVWLWDAFYELLMY